MKRVFQIQLPLALLCALFWVSGCKKDEVPEVISGFTYKVDAADFRKVAFTSAAQNAKTHAWDFGDGSTSTDVSPTHSYAAAGTYTVKLTVTGDGGGDASQQVVTLVDPDAELTKLVGSTSKNWKLLRVVNGNRWPLEVGPIDRSTVWWAMGKDNDEIAARPCLANDEWIFSRDGKMQYKTNGDFWAEGGLFKTANICASSVKASYEGPAGEDFSAWGDGNHTFTLVNGTNQTLEVKGLGAFIGLVKIATDAEVKVPQTSVKLDVVKLSDGAVDTLILESKFKFNPADPADGAYWKIVLVHYDDPTAEPAIPQAKPQPSFTTTASGRTITFNNTSKHSTSYAWDFGDGGSSTETSPTHTYASNGVYTVKLTATGTGGVATSQTDLTVSDGIITEADVIGGGKPWKVKVGDKNTVFVGGALGNADWWQVPLTYFDGTETGVNNWSCMPDDEFIFKAGGVYEYKTNGTARNDGYMGAPNGCWSDAEIAASGNGAAFGSGVHSFQFVPGASSPSGRPLLILKNGASGAAFLGFYKGYYGGENTDGTKPPNGGNLTNQYEIISYVNDGTVETMVISVDITADHSGTAAWSAVLVR